MGIKKIGNSLSDWWLAYSDSTKNFLMVFISFAASLFIIVLHHASNGEIKFDSSDIPLAILIFVMFMFIFVMWTKEAENARELRKLNKQLEERAMLDPLTGLYNRAFIPRAAKLIARQAARNESEMVCFMIDLDWLKKINDNLGHLAGDEVIKAFANKLRYVFRASDFIFRIGGDEFMVLSWAKNPHEFYQKVLKKIQPFTIEWEKKEITISATCGLAHEKIEAFSNGQIPEEYAEKIYAAIYGKADADLYVKKTGRESKNS